MTRKEESDRAIVRGKVEQIVRECLKDTKFLHALRELCIERFRRFPEHTIWAPSITGGTLLVAIVWPNREMEELHIEADAWCAYAKGW